MTRPLLLAGLALLTTGCSELEPFLPKVRFQQLEVRDLSFQHVDADFVFHVENPNPIEVGLESFSYDLALASVPLLAGTNDEGFTLERRGSSRLALPVDLVFAEVWETIQATRGQDTVDFRLAGHLGFDTPAGPARLPYDESGHFPALRTPRFQIDRLRVVQVDLTTADLALDLDVDNDHGATLFFDTFQYKVNLQGQNVVSGGVNSFAVEGATTESLTLPIRVHLLNAGATLLDAILNGGGLDVQLNAHSDVDTPFGVLPLSLSEQAHLNLNL